MRSLILLVSTIFILSVGFLIYWWVQSPVKGPPINTSQYTPVPEKTDNSDGPVDYASGPWLQTFDAKTAKVAYQFRAAQLVPTRDGRNRANGVEAEFFLRDDQRLRITGRTGIITLSRAPAKGSNALAMKQPTGPPTRGELKNVVLTLLDDRDPAAPATILTVTMDNASFDNESFKIFTESYTDRRDRVVSADEVPVHMVGRDYDFDGRGLTIRWNERDRVLELLEIAHGDRLVIKHPGQRFGGQAIQAAATAPLPVASGLRSHENPAPLPWALDIRGGRGLADTSSAPAELIASRAMELGLSPASPALGDAIDVNPVRLLDLATASRSMPVRDRPARGNPASPVPAAAPPAPTTVPSDHDIREAHARSTSPMYCATFNDNVHIVRGADTTITADILRVDFPMQSERPAATQPATEPSAPGAAVPGAPPPKAQSHPAQPDGPSAKSQNPAHENVAVGSALNTTTAPAATDGAGDTQPPDGRHAHASTEPAIAATAPSTEPTDTEVVVTWTGLLRVEPLKGAAAMPPGESMVSLYGILAPVIAVQQSSELRAGIVTFQTESKEVNATPDKNGRYPVTLKMHDAHGDSDIHTTSLRFTQPAGAGHVALLRGKSSATLPAQASGGPPLHVEWTEAGTFYFAESADGRSPIDHARLDGHVRVDHPQMQLLSDVLTLDFETGVKSPATHPATEPTAVAPTATEPTAVARRVELASLQGGALPAGAPASQPTTRNAPSDQTNLKQLEAEGNVHCLMNDGPAKKTLDCDRLSLVTTSDGLFLPRTLNADGNVHAVDPDQDLHCGHLAVTLTTRPATQPAHPAEASAATTHPLGAVGLANAPVAGVAGMSTGAGKPLPTTHPATSPSAQPQLAVQSMLAHDNVLVKTKDGTLATADQLLVDTRNGRPSLKLLGAPAHIVSKQSTLTGPVIELFPDDQQLSVDGPGTLHGEQNMTSGATTRPVDMTWSSNLHVDGKNNLVEVFGQVFMTMQDADGTIDEMKGDRVKLILADVPAAPTTRPATAPATQHTGAAVTAAPRTAPAGAATVPTARRAHADSREGASSATLPTARRAHVDSGEKAAPTTLATAVPATLPIAPSLNDADDKMNVLGHKTIRQAIFQDNAEAHSVLMGPGGAVLRRIELYAPTIQYDVIPKPATQPTTRPQSIAAIEGGVSATSRPSTQPVLLKRLTVPCAGEMIVEDHRPEAPAPHAAPPSATQPGKVDPAAAVHAAGAPAAPSQTAAAGSATGTAPPPAGTAGQPLAAKPAGKSPGDGSDRGDSAFRWSRSMVYDDATQQMVMDGDVHIVHLEDAKKDDRITVDADQVTADLSDPAHIVATTGPAQTAHATLSKVIARGHVHVVTHGGDLTANTMVYDPPSHTIIARGTDSVPAVFSQSVPGVNGYKPMSADEIDLDTQSDLPTLIHPRGQMMR